MPYIITTTQREITGSEGAWRGSVLEHEVSRTAVATLEDAREAALQGIEDAYRGQVPHIVDSAHGLEAFHESDTDAEELLESGGTVGPLPDGTVIEVRPASWMDLKIHTDLPGDPHGTLSNATILAAFNGAQA